MKKIIFIDIDGTLITMKDGKQYIPQSAINVINKARQKGILIYLCTGRSIGEVNTIPEIDVDGVIGAAGGYIESNNQVIYHQTMKPQDVNEIIDLFEKENIIYFLECNEGFYLNEQSYQFMFTEWLQGDTTHPIYSIMHQLEFPFDHPVNKISFHSHTLTYNDIEKIYKDRFTLVKSSYTDDVEAGEISIHNINKATAISYLLDFLPFKNIQTYGFGDSMNDIEMFECVDIAVAMGNSKHGVKELADFVTKDVEEDGIAYAFEQLKILED